MTANKLLRKIWLWSCIALIANLSAASPADDLTPEWVKDLVIYEVATKGFTSPDGPESGTFQGLMEKMPYLEELGINAIWLTGHSPSDPKHFYGIWTQYACIDPNKLDPSLGTEEQFKAMITEAHNRNIRIFLDTIEHGVMNYSPLISEHSDWFKGGSWGMTDYDWEGDHPDLEEWWVEMWTDAVLEWGVDGFRCDMGLYRPDLWQEIRRRCAAAGKPIFILGESGYENISDANQRDIMVFNQRRGLMPDHQVLRNLPAMNELFHKPFDPQTVTFMCDVEYLDGTTDQETARGGTLELLFTGMGADVIGTWERPPDGRPDWTWSVRGIDSDRDLKNVVIVCQERSWKWQSHATGTWQMDLSGSGQPITASGGNPIAQPRYRTISISNHDCGWDGFPTGKNAYMAQGSRANLGYGVLLAPAIPIMMAGEEFNADFKPLPGLTPGLFREGDPGTGTWLYGSWLQWDQLEQSEHRAMLTDTKRLIAIRREHQDLIYAITVDNVDIQMNAVPVAANEDIPVPYILSNGKRALLVVSNPTAKAVDIELEITLARLGLPARIKTVQQVELWPHERKARRVKTKKLSKYKVTVPPDKIPGGGLHIVRFEPGG